MMKTLSTIMAGVIAGAMLTACSSGSSKTTSQDSATDSDSIATVAATEETPQQVLTTPDLRFAEASGNIKSIKINETVYQFDAEGNLTSGLPNLKRDKEGLIKEWGFGGENILSWENGVPASLINRESDGGTITSTYTYNSDGQLIKQRVHNDLPGDEPWDEVLTYTYPEGSLDTQGNWVSRKVSGNPQIGSYTETRTIVYY